MERKDFKMLWVDPDHLEAFIEILIAPLVVAEGFNIETSKEKNVDKILEKLKSKNALVIHIGTWYPNPGLLWLIRKVKEETNCIIIVPAGREIKFRLDRQYTELIEHFLFWKSKLGDDFIKECARKLQDIIDQETAAGR